MIPFNPQRDPMRWVPFLSPSYREKKQKLREAKLRVQGHRAKKQQSREAQAAPSWELSSVIMTFGLIKCTPYSQASQVAQW